MTTTKKMVEVKVAAKELGVAQSKIKDLIKNKFLSYEFVNGHYVINIEEIKDVLKKRKPYKTTKKTPKMIKRRIAKKNKKYIKELLNSENVTVLDLTNFL